MHCLKNDFIFIQVQYVDLGKKSSLLDIYDQKK